MDDILRDLAARRAEIEAEFREAVDAIPTAAAAVRAAVDAHATAQWRNNNVVERVSRAVQQRGNVSTVLQDLLAAERVQYDRAGAALAKARHHLANLKWVAECRRDDLHQLDAFVTPPKISDVLLPPVKRPAPEQVDVDDIVFPMTSRKA
jgi:hypothetical protein